MASSNFQTEKPFSVLVSISITFFFLFLLKKVNSSEELHFAFTNFGPNQKNLLLQGDAQVSRGGVLQLTNKPISPWPPIPYPIPPFYSSVGRALYAAPVHIWDSSTGKMADFVTSFSFVVNAAKAAKPAHGIAFFLAPPDSDIPPSSSGGYLGLFSDKFYKYQTVAVEFDTYSNIWDPPGPHIGIDVNSVRSINTVNWLWRDGEIADVYIYYQAANKTLTATLTYPNLLNPERYILSAVVDLSRVLPEWVRVGFSATAGVSRFQFVDQRFRFIDQHDVRSWSFTSILETSGSGEKDNNAFLASYA